MSNVRRAPRAVVRARVIRIRFELEAREPSRAIGDNGVQKGDIDAVTFLRGGAAAHR
jgi:hypothetical protein